MRDAYAAAVLQIEVIAQQRRALLVYGTAHLQRRNVVSNFEMEDWRSQTIVSLVERAGPARVFTITGSNDENGATAGQPPALALIRGFSDVSTVSIPSEPLRAARPTRWVCGASSGSSCGSLARSFEGVAQLSDHLSSQD
jgi:hypothetical protein